MVQKTQIVGAIRVPMVVLPKSSEAPKAVDLSLVRNSQPSGETPLACMHKVRAFRLPQDSISERDLNSASRVPIRSMLRYLIMAQKLIVDRSQERKVRLEIYQESRLCRCSCNRLKVCGRKPLIATGRKPKPLTGSKWKGSVIKVVTAIGILK